MPAFRRPGPSPPAIVTGLRLVRDSFVVLSVDLLVASTKALSVLATLSDRQTFSARGEARSIHKGRSSKGASRYGSKRYL